MLKLAQNPSGAHRAQGTNWLGKVTSGCRDSEVVIYSKVRNLGCGGVGRVLDYFQNRGLVQLIQVGRIFWDVV